MGDFKKAGSLSVPGKQLPADSLLILADQGRSGSLVGQLREKNWSCQTQVSAVQATDYKYCLFVYSGKP